MPKAALQSIDPAKRERIFRAAAEEFGEKGYGEANVNEIARRAGIAKGAIYVYFVNKRDLYFSTAVEGMNVAIAAFAPLFERVQQGDFFGVVEDGIRLAIRFSRTHRPYYLMYLNSTYGGSEFKETLFEYVHVLREQILKPFVEAGQRAGQIRADIDIDMAAFFYYTIVMSFQDACVQPMLHPSLKLEEEARIEARIAQLLDLLRHGLGANGAVR